MSKLDMLARRACAMVLTYGLACVSVAIALLVTLLLRSDELVTPVFFLAIMLSAWLGGIGPGLLAALLATLAIAYFFLQPLYSLQFDPANVPQLLVFFLSAVLVSSWSAARKRAETLLLRARDDQEAKVQERTADLNQTNETLRSEIAERQRMEETLRERADLLDLTHDTVFVRDMRDVITYWNRGAAEQYGWQKAEAVGQVSHDLLRTSFPAPLDEIHAELLSTGRWEGELVHTKRDGTQIVVASRWSLQRDVQGNPLAILETNNDITERRRAEAALRESEEQWKAVFEHNPTMYFMVDAAGTILSVNPFGAEQLGYTVDELAGSPVLNVFYAADREAVQRNVAVCLEHLGQARSWELRKVRKDGMLLWVRETAQAVLLKNRPVVLVVCEDITERKRAEEALRHSERYLAEAQRLSHTGSWAWDGANKMGYYWSEEMYRIFGWDPQQSVPTSEDVWQRIHPEDRDGTDGGIQKAFREKAEYIHDYRIVLPDGTVKHLHALGHPVCNAAGDVVEYVGTVVDVTERKRAEEERQAHLGFLESLERVNRAMQGTNDLEQMLGDVLDAVLAIFDCDRAWLTYPCDPDTTWWRVVMESTRPEFPGASALGGPDLPMEPQVAEVFRAVRAADGPVRWGPGGQPVPGPTAERFRVQSLLAMALDPKVDRPYMFGLHQCSSPRVWTPQEERLFQEIGRRLEDALTTLLMFRHLQDSERKLEEAQRVAHVGYWDLDLDTNRMTISDEAYRIFGLPPQEGSVHRAWWVERWQALVHPEDWPRVIQAEAEALRGGPRYDVEYRVVRPNGEVRIVHSQGDVTWDEAGRPRRIFGTVQDITERRRAEEELRESEQRYRYIFQTAGVSIWEEDFSQVKSAIDDLKAQGVRNFRQYLAAHPAFVQHAIAMVKIIDVNDATVKLFGARSKEELLVSLRQVFLPETEDVFAGELLAIAEGRTSFAAETVLQTLQGNRLAVLLTMTFPPQPAQLDSVLVSITDITERKRAEEALQKAQAELAHVTRVTTLGELATSIAHEINQPLAAIVTNGSAGLRWLAGAPPNLDDAREALQCIIDDGQRAGEVITRLRALLRKTASAPTRLTLAPLVHEVVRLLQHELVNQGVALYVEVAADLPAVVGDRVQVQQVLLNLVLNSLEALATVTERPREVWIRVQPEAADTVRVAVEDTGVGLAPEQRDQMFTAFYTTKAQGLGMGLAISRTIVEQHGGRLWAVPHDGPGATVQFTLRTVPEEGAGWDQKPSSSWTTWESERR